MTQMLGRKVARLMYLKCSSCTYVREFYTSKKIECDDAEHKGGERFMEVNLRYAKVGYTQLKKP